MALFFTLDAVGWLCCRDCVDHHGVDRCVRQRDRVSSALLSACTHIREYSFITLPARQASAVAKSRSRAQPLVWPIPRQEGRAETLVGALVPNVLMARMVKKYNVW